MPIKSTIFWRDITIPAGGNTYFVPPEKRDYWFINLDTTNTITINKSGRNPILVPASSVTKLECNEGEEVALTGTANQVLTITDTYDVKNVPQAKDVLGKVILTDGTNTVAVVGGNQLAVQASIIGTPNVSIATIPIGSTATQGIFRFGQFTTTAGVVHQLSTATIGTIATLIIQNEDATNSIWIGLSSVTATTGQKLAAGQNRTYNQVDPSLVYVIDDGTHTVRVTFTGSN